MQKGWILLTLFALYLPLSSSSSDIVKLSQERYWQQLLHFRDGKSEIDSKEFFLSPKGKTDIKAELEATLEAIASDKKVFCKFPARISWLNEKIPSLKGYQKCEPLESLIKKYQAFSAVLVFPTAHINSPASMFGHTFLRLDNKKGLVLMAHAVNYAAKTAESNGLIFAYQGLFGGYEGRYSVLPYYKKIKEYNNLERRDIWEYRLNLEEDELRRLLMHLYELKDVYSDYFFFTENCSYNLLWLLEVARPKTNLVKKFSIKAIPIDTIRVVKEAGFIKDVDFRPSKTKRIKSLLFEEKRALGRIKEAYQAEIGVELLQLRRIQNSVDKKSYIKELMVRLDKRSKLPTLSKLETTRPVNPLLSHKSARVEVGIDEKKAWKFGFKLAFHDIYDLKKGFIPGAYIDFFHLLLSKERYNEVKLKNLNLLNINSYAARDKIFKPFSWGVQVGAEEFRYETYFKLKGEVGLSYAYANRLFGFMMIKPSFYYHDSLIGGLGAKFGVIVNFEDIKLGLMGEKNFYSDGGDDLHVELFSTIMTDTNSALNLKIDSDKIGQTKVDTRLSVSLFYYF